ncbi:hypothetical protein FRC12_004567 [Ceratobasidium sp. 428]|nr:hypothetical protein FRC12_004567 [Ceratobasidium sp. 428]
MSAIHDFNLESNSGDVGAKFVEEDLDFESKPASTPSNKASSLLTKFQTILDICMCLWHHVMKIDAFLLGLCYRNERSVTDTTMKKYRGQLMGSHLLPRILNNLHTPPNYTGSCPKAAQAKLENWAWEHVIWHLGRAQKVCQGCQAA